VTESALADLWSLVRAIPFGRCVSYGDLGRMLRHPSSGYQVGRWMALSPNDLPWWRVVSKDGRLPVHKRDPRMAEQQRALLEQEGVEFVEGRIPMGRFGWYGPEA
jgi:methylated-DNA-protein-cysteine methyltransferase-like protein